MSTKPSRNGPRERSRLPRKRGTRLGDPRSSEFIAQARQIKDLIPPAPQLVETMRRHRAESMTLRAIADQANWLGLRTPKGLQWYAGPCGTRWSKPANLYSALMAQLS